MTTAGDAREADRPPDRFLPCSDDRNRDYTVTSTDATAFTLDQNIQRLQQQIASTQIAKELAELDLGWECVRRKYLDTSNNPAGGIPDRSDAIGALVIAGVFALVLILGTVLLNSYLVLFLASPILAALGLVSIVAIYQYGRAREYQRALAGYQAQRSRIELSSGTTTGTVHSSAQPLASEATFAELIDRIAEQRYQAALASLDRAWEIEREKHYVRRPKGGGRFIPTRQVAVETAVGGMVVGVVMVVTGTPTYFPYFGVVFAVLGIGGGFHLYNRARKYALALSTYQTRRKQLCREQFVDISPGILRHGAVAIGRAEGDAERGTATGGGGI